MKQSRPGKLAKGRAAGGAAGDLAALFTQAVNHDRAGRPAEAEKLCRLILRRLPDEVPVLHLLGLVLCKMGRLVDGAQMLGRVIGLAPGHTAALKSLGDAFHGLGRGTDSVAVYRHLATLQPDDADTWVRLGISLQETGQAADAADAFRRALTLAPGSHELMVNLGMALEAQGKADEALAAYAAAGRAVPDHAPAFLGIGNIFAQQGRGQDAIAAYSHALTLAPDWPEALTNLGLALQTADRLDEAVQLHRRAATLAPDYVNAHVNLGTALQLLGRGDEAVASYRRAVALEPAHAANLSNLGQALAEQGKVDEALAVHAQAAERAPADPVVRFNQALTHLLAGDDARGWPQYGWRWRGGVPNLKDRGLPMPEWQGEDLASRTLLVHAEQGLGDTLQFMRFLSRLPPAGRVVFEVQAPLAPLLRQGLDAPGIEVVTQGQPLPPADLHLPLMSLPHRLGVADEAGLAATGPYLGVAEADAARWRAALPADRLKVGVAWSGNPRHRADRLRSIPLTDLAKQLEPVLTARPDVAPYAVQTDRRPGDAAILDRMGVAAPELADFTDTAALVANLDLVITVDTAVAHLAGALGRPVWLLLPFAPDWRWRLGRDDTPWYAATRLFRQERQGDWTAPLARVATALTTVQRV
ncbi:MAG: tetratricopeptide repeat protein [Azospirillaceae bacterium]|nr:tetratricopeptide repeat protein [Azospirillaceae bacterium]